MNGGEMKKRKKNQIEDRDGFGSKAMKKATGRHYGEIGQSLDGNFCWVGLGGRGFDWA